MEIGVDDLAPSGVIERLDGLRGTGDAGVVDEHVETLAAAHQRGELGDRLGVADVAGDGGGVWQAGGEALQRALAAGGEDEMKAAFGERFGDGEAETARGSGDES